MSRGATPKAVPLCPSRKEPLEVVKLMYLLGSIVLAAAVVGCSGEETSEPVAPTNPPPAVKTAAQSPNPSKAGATEPSPPPGHEPSSGSATTKGTAPAASKPAAKQPAQAKLPGWNPSAPTQSMSGGLQYRDAKVGTGKVAKAGDQVTVNYTGYLMSGKKFDSSLDSGQPFGFTLGAGGVIKGWDEGVAGMKVGGKRTLIIPAELGYGAAGNPSIPGGATLVFDVQLLSTGP